MLKLKCSECGKLEKITNAILTAKCPECGKDQSWYVVAVDGERKWWNPLTWLRS